MTKKRLDYKYNKYFVICMILTKDVKKLKRVFKRFISSNLDLLKKEDKNHKMFYKSGKFKELKGSCLSFEFKKKIIDYFCRNKLFDIYYICSSNERVDSLFYNNTARAFNYLIRLSIEHNTNEKRISKSTNFFYIDERNVKTNTVSALCEYLNIELVTAKHIQNMFCVVYCQSESKELIQLADVFSNIYYSYILKGNILDKEINRLRNNGYIRNEFYFPLN